MLRGVGSSERFVRVHCFALTRSALEFLSFLGLLPPRRDLLTPYLT